LAGDFVELHPGRETPGNLFDKLDPIDKKHFARRSKRSAAKMPKNKEQSHAIAFSPMNDRRKMNPARKIPRVPDSNPLSVLESIQASSGIANQLVQPAASSDSQPTPGNPPAPALTESLMPLRINPDTTDSIDDQTSELIETHVESAKQIQQLAIRLKQSELDLQHRSNQLDQEILTWNQTVSQQEAMHQKSHAQLQQQASHVRCQQLQLIQLQTDIVKSYEAARRAIESLFNEPTSHDSSLSALKALKYEVSGRFDFICRRWEHLAKLMHNLRDQQAIQNSSDDSVDWLGEGAIDSNNEMH
jgi:hypothetical protein